LKNDRSSAIFEILSGKNNSEELDIDCSQYFRPLTQKTTLHRPPWPQFIRRSCRNGNWGGVKISDQTYAESYCSDISIMKKWHGFRKNIRDQVKGFQPKIGRIL